MEITLDKVTFLKSSALLLDDIAFSIKKGEITSIVSKNEDELNSLMLIISKLIKPTTGNVDNPYNFGISFANPEEMFFKDNVSDELNYTEDMKELLKTFNFNESLLSLNPFLLSEGEKRLLSIMISMTHGKDFIFLESPSYGLDTYNNEALIKTLKGICKKEKIGIVIFTNDTDLALKVSNDVIILSNGKVMKQGSKYDVLSDDNIMSAAKLSVPMLLEFSNLVKINKRINIGYRDEIKDLIKDIFRYVN